MFKYTIYFGVKKYRATSSTVISRFESVRNLKKKNPSTSKLGQSQRTLKKKSKTNFAYEILMMTYKALKDKFKGIY